VNQQQAGYYHYDVRSLIAYCNRIPEIAVKVPSLGLRRHSGARHRGRLPPKTKKAREIIPGLCVWKLTD